ncbi:pro-resilin-like [Achroia grisella]|uniref:pro-resilin-like n=1 Tax=Achroia grisella TaxID=688607 RepID=UPI0027D1F009|nr:pro-resilin-like [Achroia grisella]XP_059054549.1 pro-resilin-like [Achroia grisella]
MDSCSSKRWLCCLVASTVVAMATGANEYLPPSKGYNYEPPKVPFPTNNNGISYPTPSPGRPTPSRPYVPPGPTPGPRPTPGPTYVPPGPTSQPINHHDHDHSHDHDHHHHEPGMPFDFAYAVNEDGNDYSHNAISDGDVTRGEYRVALPDGRTQIVKYTADWRNGFNAEVTYEGEARYPDQPAGYPGPSSGPGQSYVPPSQGGGYQY